jgi:hypothetical protein
MPRLCVANPTSNLAGPRGRRRGHPRDRTPCTHRRPAEGLLPQQSGYNERLRALADTLPWPTGVLARDTGLFADDVWVVDSTPVECARSRETVHRSRLAGWAEYGFCARHTRCFWGPRLHVLCTLHGLPVGFALPGAKDDERDVPLGLLDADPTLGVLVRLLQRVPAITAAIWRDDHIGAPTPRSLIAYDH